MCYIHFKEQLRLFYFVSNVSDPDQLKQLQALCELLAKNVDGAPTTVGQQELFPGCGVQISSYQLAAITHAAKPNCMRLFHGLFDHFFSVADCRNAVPFGRPGGSQGKKVLDRTKVDAIRSKFNLIYTDLGSHS